MRIGYRVVGPEEVGLWKADIVQISVYRGQARPLDTVRDCASACVDRGISHVLHPVGYGLLEPGALNALLEMAQWAGEALILHDERAPDNGRLGGALGDYYVAALDELGALARVSLENSTFTQDVRWFWDAFAGSVTLDMGHMESSGMDSLEFVKGLDENTVAKVDYVHMHRNWRLRGGITDHWPLTPGCRELGALSELLGRKGDVAVILEINETDMTGESLGLIRALGEAGLT
jgi:hypothetical protein